MLSSVIENLEYKKQRTFTYAEMEYFKMWWGLQDEKKKESVRSLIKSGQLNLVNGGLSAPDEACTNHDDLIDNFMSGHKFITQEVGVEQPKISWQIDAFGVSQGYARLAKDIGFDAMFFARVDAEEKK